MTEPRIPVTVVNHAAVEIEVSPDVAWASIRSFLNGEKFAEAGYVVEPLDEPAAVLGGYRMRLEKDGAVDERIIHITELDETARRLSLRADYLSFPGGLKVYATYHAQESGDGARYALDCHSRMSVEAPADGSKADVAAAIDQFKTGSDDFLKDGLEKLKLRLEGTRQATQTPAQWARLLRG